MDDQFRRRDGRFDQKIFIIYINGLTDGLGLMAGAALGGAGLIPPRIPGFLIGISRSSPG